MFIWVTLPEGIDAEQLLLKAIDEHVAFVPGTPFYATEDGKPNTLRLSFVTVSEERIREGIAILGRLIREQAKDRKSTRLNSSHVAISYAVFCLKKKN